MDFSLGTTERGNDEESASVRGRAEKCNVASVRRPNGVPISGGIRRQSQRDVGPDDLDINILVVLLLTVPAKGNLTTIGRKAGVAFLARKTGQRKCA